MLTYTSADALPPPAPAEIHKIPWLLILLCVLWLVPGLIGHDPWKPQENQTAAIVQQMLQGKNWLVPHVGDSPYLWTAPLFYWSATALAYLLNFLGVATHDAARLTAGLWMALALLGVGLTGHVLHAPRQGRLAVTLLLGSVGLLFWGHRAGPAALILAAFAWLPYALWQARRRPLLGGCLLGGCWLLLLLGATAAEVILAMSLALGLLFFRGWRQAEYYVSLMVAVVLAVPLAGFWFLHLQADTLAFYEWVHRYAWGLFGSPNGVRFFHDPGYLFSIVAWFAWPTLPLALWGGWVFRKQWREERFQLLLLNVALVLIWLVLSFDPDEQSATLLLIPLAVLGACGVDELKRGAASALNWFGIMTFGSAALALWVCWLALLTGEPAQIVSSLQQYSPEGSVHVGLGALFSVLITLAWIYTVLFRKRPLGRRSVTAWACGMALVWGLMIGLGQSWVDPGKSYRSAGQGLALAVQGANPCVQVQGLGETQMAALQYFSGLELRRSGVCRYRLLGFGLANPEVGWQLIWVGGRPDGHPDNRPDARERFYLYRQDLP